MSRISIYISYVTEQKYPVTQRKVNAKFDWHLILVSVTRMDLTTPLTKKQVELAEISDNLMLTI